MASLVGGSLVGAGLVPIAAAQPPPDRLAGSGTATFTDLTGGGACSFLGEPPDNLHVGISSREYGTADLCGGYMDVTGPGGGIVRVKITDHCVNCAFGLLDLTRKAFSQIADVDLGRVPVSYQLVRNPPLAGSISLRVKESSSRWWLQIQALDHGNPIAGFELSSATSTGWRSLEHTPDNYWMAREPGPGDGPFFVRITDIYGQSVTIEGVALDPGAVQVTSARLYPAQPVQPGPSASAVPTSPSTPPPTVSAAPATVRPTSRSNGSTTTTPSKTTNTDTVVPVFVVLGGLAVVARLVVVRRRRGQRSSREGPLRRLA